MDSIPQNYYDLTTIAARTGASYGVLRRYAELPAVQQKLGAESLPGVKGVRWPEASLPLWQSIIDAHRRKIITPGTVAAHLQQSDIALQQSDTGGAIVPLAQSGNSSNELTQLGNDAVAMLARIVQLMESNNAANPPDDRLLTLKQAQEETGVPLHVLRGLRVRVGRRWYCRRSDCLRWIASL